MHSSIISPDTNKRNGALKNYGYSIESCMWPTVGLHKSGFQAAMCRISGLTKINTGGRNEPESSFKL